MQRIVDIYNIVADMTKKRVEEEKETKLSSETRSMISLTLQLYNCIPHDGKEPLLFGDFTPTDSNGTTYSPLSSSIPRKQVQSGKNPFSFY